MHVLGKQLWSVLSELTLRVSRHSKHTGSSPLIFLSKWKVCFMIWMALCESGSVRHNEVKGECFHYSAVTLSHEIRKEISEAFYSAEASKTSTVSLCTQRWALNKTLRKKVTVWAFKSFRRNKKTWRRKEKSCKYLSVSHAFLSDFL